jgi:hypothetical protein
MTAATLFLVVLGGIVDLLVDEVQPSGDWFVSRMLVAIVLGVAVSLAVTLVLLTGVNLLTVVT